MKGQILTCHNHHKEVEVERCDTLQQRVLYQPFYTEVAGTTPLGKHKHAAAGLEPTSL